MARVTRSKKIVIAEDDDVYVAAEVALPDTPVKAREALGELDGNTGEAMTVEEVEVSEQVKGLKAAFKAAIGAKKNKKGKKNNKSKREQSVEENNPSEDLVVLDDQETAEKTLAIEETRQILSSDEGSPHISPKEHGQT
jgi:hypothetical protein